MTIGILLLAAVLFLAAFPLKNYLEIKKVRNKEIKWMNWLGSRPSKAEYIALHHQNFENIICDYCGVRRQYPSLEMVMTNEPKFGFINNSFNKYVHFKTYICSGCNTELYRERYVE